MALAVVVQQVLEEPLVGFHHRLGLMEVKQRLEALFHRTETTFHFALRASGGTAATGVPRGIVHLERDPKLFFQHALKDPRLGERSVIHVQDLGQALEGERRVVFGRQCTEQEQQCRLDFLPVHQMILLVIDSAMVVNDAE